MEHNVNTHSTTGGNIAPALNSIIERLEKLDDEKASVQSDIRDVYKDAKAKDLNVGTIREIVRMRKLDAAVREEREHFRDVYLRALGLLDDEE